MDRAAPNHDRDSHDFDGAAQLFRTLAAPLRLRIINALCSGERNVGELLAAVPTTQPNMSQHLKVLYDAGVIGKRRAGVQVYYHITNPRVVGLCQALCQESAAALRH